MKAFEDLIFNDDVRYSKEHVWIKVAEDEAVIGISDYAQDQLGDIIFVGLPEINATFKQNEIFGFVESVKTASDLYIPAAGKVIAVNETLADNPEAVNNDPFGDGWLIRIRCEDYSQFEALLTSHQYKQVCHAG